MTDIERIKKMATWMGWKEIGKEKVHCPGCHWRGTVKHLKEDKRKDALVCPSCGTVGWEFD